MPSKESADPHFYCRCTLEESGMEKQLGEFEWLEKYFLDLRRSKTNNHLGLGEIALSVDQQDEILGRLLVGSILHQSREKKQFVRVAVSNAELSQAIMTTFQCLGQASTDARPQLHKQLTEHLSLLLEVQSKRARLIDS